MNTKVIGIYKLSKRDPLHTLGHGQTENEGMKKKMFHTNENQKKAGVAILISEKKIDYKIKLLQETRKGTKIMIKGSIREENVMIVNIYISQIGALQHLR